MKSFIYLLLIVSFSHSCRRNIEAGIETTVSGQVYDFNKEQPISNVPILVQEYEAGLYGPRMKRVIDSTLSGADGRYLITFTTTGQGSQYRIVFSPDDNFYTLQGAVPLIAGKDTFVDFSAIELHTLKAEIRVVNNSNPPLRIAAQAGSRALLYGTNMDTTVFLKIFPNRANEIRFYITNVDTPSINNVRLDTIMFQGFSDTFTTSLQVDPRFFTKRR